MTAAVLHSPVRRAGVLLGVVAMGIGITGGLRAPGAAAASDTTGGAVTRQVTATRSYLAANGRSVTTDTRHIALHVATTTNLRGRQEVTVSWSGAHPTGGLVADVNSGDAAGEEYPFVLLQCRGVDSTGVPAAERISPQTCWTQTAQERYQEYFNSAFPPWRLDRYASRGDRAAVVDRPRTIKANCDDQAPAERFLPFVAASGAVYPGGPGGCAGAAPEAANVSGAGLPSNATYGVTAKDGRGSTQFDIFTGDENASLGCSQKVACSLVAVPVEGISCDAYGHAASGVDLPDPSRAGDDDALCRKSGNYEPGAIADQGIRPALATTGYLWWSASNWRNRITVPLHFAAPANACSVTGGSSGVNLFGSVPFAEAAGQWAPRFCTDSSLSPFTFVQTSDPAARQLLRAGSIDAALGSFPPDGSFGRPVAQAPVAVSGFAISYVIDDDSGQRLGTLRLDARLLAKLLTESYPADRDVVAQYPALAHNSLNITQDPEFRALNPTVPQLNYEAAAELVSISSESDVVRALSSYLQADPEARAWLDGTPDPWGMVVNPHYKGIALPVAEWPLLDDFEFKTTNGNNLCYEHSPSPWLNLIANPTALLGTVAFDVQFGLSNVSIGCNASAADDTANLRLTNQGRQQPGHRFLIGLTSLGEAERYGLSTAALQTTRTGSGGPFTDAAGRTFVAPTAAALRIAAQTFRADTGAGTWVPDYAALRTHAPRGYPGTMIVLADVPTSGLAKADAATLASFLRYAAGRGQRTGLETGQLPPGYLPMTAGNGLAAFVSYTDRAAQAVAEQRGAVPSLVAPPASHVAANPTASPGVDGDPSGGVAGGGPLVSSNGEPVLGSTAVAGVARSNGAPQGSIRVAGSTRSTLRPAADGGAWLLPAIGLITLLAALLAPLVRDPTLIRRPTVLVTSLLRRGGER